MSNEMESQAEASGYTGEGSTEGTSLSDAYSSGGPSMGVFADPSHPNTTNFAQFTDNLQSVLSSSWGSFGRGLLASALGPAGIALNFGYNMLTSKDPIATALGAIPGWGGKIASAGYGMMKSEDPIGFLGNKALSTLAGYAGGQIAGPYGGKLAGGLINQALSANRGLGNTGNFQTGALAGMANFGNLEGSSDSQNWDELITKQFGWMG